MSSLMMQTDIYAKGANKTTVKNRNEKKIEVLSGTVVGYGRNNSSEKTLINSS